MEAFPMILTMPGGGNSRPTSTGGPGHRSDEAPAMTSIHLPFDIIRLDSDADHLSAVECPTCRGTLSLHQPDQALPDRLVAACHGCRGWLLIDVTEAIIVRLPDWREVQDAWAAPTGPPESDPRSGH